jgi:hypothetical protein
MRTTARSAVSGSWPMRTGSTATASGYSCDAQWIGPCSRSPAGVRSATTGTGASPATSRSAGAIAVQPASAPLRTPSISSESAQAALLR